MNQALTLLLSAAVLYFYFESLAWRRHTEAANRRRKRVEEDSEAQTARMNEAYKVRGDVLKNVGELRSRALDKIVELNREASTREALIVELRKSVLDHKEARHRNADEAAKAVRAVEERDRKALDREREIATLRRTLQIEEAATKSMRRHLEEVGDLLLRTEWTERLLTRTENLPSQFDALGDAYRLYERVGRSWKPVKKPKKGTLVTVPSIASFDFRPATASVEDEEAA